MNESLFPECVLKLKIMLCYKFVVYVLVKHRQEVFLCRFGQIIFKMSNESGSGVKVWGTCPYMTH